MKIVITDDSIDGAKQDEVVFRIDTKDDTLLIKDDKATLFGVKGNLIAAIAIIDKWFPE